MHLEPQIHLLNCASVSTALLFEIAKKIGCEIDPSYVTPTIGEDWILELGRHLGMRRADEDDDTISVLESLIANQLPSANQDGLAYE